MFVISHEKLFSLVKLIIVIVMSLPEIPHTYLSLGFKGVQIVVLPFAFTTISDGNENLSISPL